MHGWPEAAMVINGYVGNALPWQEATKGRFEGRGKSAAELRSEPRSASSVIYTDGAHVGAPHTLMFGATTLPGTCMMLMM